MSYSNIAMSLLCRITKSASLLIALSAIAAGTANAAELPPFAEEFFGQYCVDCHGEEKEKGDRRLDGLSADMSDPGNLILLEESLDMLNLGDMPPDEKKVKQPSLEETRQVIDWLTESLTAAENSLAPTSTVMRRLNRFEYVNTLRDLLGVHTEAFDATYDFPQDPTEEGFDNNGESLALSDYQLRRYLEVADAFLGRAIWFDSKKPQSKKLRFTADDFNGVLPEERTRAPVNWRINFHGKYMDIGHGQPVERHTNYPVQFSKTGVPEDGYYKIVVRAEAIGRLTHPYADEDFEMDFSEPMKMGLVIAPEPRLLEKNAYEGRRDVAVWDLADEIPTDYEATVWLEKGSTPFFHWSNGVASKGTIRKVADKYHPEVVRTQDYLLLEGLAEAKNLDNKTIAEVYEGPRLRVHHMEITGPSYESWPPESHRNLFGKKTNPEKINIDQTLRDFASRAFRRPQSQEDIQHYSDFVRQQKKSGKTVEEALRLGLSAILSSPKFLYLDEGDEEVASELDAYQLASRLSYFIWSSMPDEELWRLAESNRLGEPEVLGQQVDRMLKDAKAKAFVEHFTDGWLRINTLGSMLPDEKVYESYYRQRLEYAMREETRHYFESLLVSNGSILELLDSDYTFVNGPLAKHYGFEGVNGETFRRLNLPKGSHRGGLLGHASVLTVSANGVETSPVVRGIWILENILGTPPSPPPPDVEPLEPDTRGATTIREQLKKHRNVQACADCHAKIDPLGFALEFYDPIGGYRESYPSVGEGRDRMPGKRIDGSGAFPSGESFEDESGLKQALLDRKDRFAQALTEKLLIYGTGRKMTYRDHGEIERIATEVGEGGYGLRDLVIGVANSDIFGER